MADDGDKPLSGKTVLLALTGGIACYKVADLASKLVQTGATVNVAMTEAACKFITPLTFQSLTKRQVFTSLWQSSENFHAQHISLTESADLMIIAPATADIMAKMACGIADDLVSTMALAGMAACPIMVAPAMNERMWSANPTQDNVKKLKQWGIRIVGPAEGRLACGAVGAGRMVEPTEILSAAVELLG